MRLLEFGVPRNMVIGSTLFPHRSIHKINWKSPDGNAFNQIEHTLIDARHRSSLLDVWSNKGANIHSNYFLIIAKPQCKISRYYRHYKSTENKRYDIAKLAGIYKKNLNDQSQRRIILKYILKTELN
jgi:hypothetical protein